MEMTVVPQEAFYLGTLGGGVLHNQPPDHLDNLVDHVYRQNQCQHRQHAGKGDGVAGQHTVGEVTHRQGGDLTENSGKSQNQQNQQKVSLLPGRKNGKQLFYKEYVVSSSIRSFPVPVRRHQNAKKHRGKATFAPMMGWIMGLEPTIFRATI